MRRTMQTIAIPVFQFGLFSENSLSFFAGPHFAFGGRIHTNQHLYLKQDGANTLTLRDRVTAVGEVIRTHLSNGVTGTHNGNVRVARATGCPAAPAAANANCFALAGNQGSLVANLGSAENEPTWTNVSVGTSNGWLRNGRTGARRLDLPIVSDGASPVDLLRRPPIGEATDSAVGRQRYYNMATLRILVSDQPGDLTALPGVAWSVGATPVRLAGAFVPGLFTGAVVGPQAFASSSGAGDDGFRTRANVPSLDGWILINMQDRAGNWTDVTEEVLSLGFSGRRLSNGTLDVPDFNNACASPHPNAIIRLQRVRDTMTDAAGGCTPALPPTLGTDYWPNVLYDAREGMLRDDQAARPTAPNPSGIPGVADNQQRLYWSGVTHYVDLDVNNLRRWLQGEIGSSGSVGCLNGAGGNDCPMDVTGFVVYFSDRRTNRDLTGGAAEVVYTADGFQYLTNQETGEFGFEDVINPGNSDGQPNDALDAQFQDADGNDRWAEDVNENGVLDTYGGTARLLPADAGPGTLTMLGGLPANYTPVGGLYNLYTTPIDRNVARVNRAFFFRRALKLVNGGRGNLPANGTQGLTVVAENPVYIEGNFNACTNALPTQGNNFAPACAGGGGFGNTPGVDHVSAAVLADAVTFLSNAWNDIRSFRNPHNARTSGLTTANARQASTTWYRLAIIAGKHLSFPRPNNNVNDHTDFGTDGGAHNFIRYIERWNTATLNYRGALVSFYSSRQAVGTYKCCDIVYGPPTRGYNFDTDFLTPNLLPPRTPMFRDINTLTFRQILRPTQ